MYSLKISSASGTRGTNSVAVARRVFVTAVSTSIAAVAPCLINARRDRQATGHGSRSNTRDIDRAGSVAYVNHSLGNGQLATPEDGDQHRTRAAPAPSGRSSSCQ
jgi:hypothetical protein